MSQRMMTREDAVRRLEQLIHDPWARDETIEDVFLNAMAEELLMAGRTHYRRRGRGVLLFDLRGVLGWRRGQMPTMYYLTYEDLLAAGATPNATTKAEIESYNPDSEIPVLFIYDGNSRGRVISEHW